MITLNVDPANLLGELDMICSADFGYGVDLTEYPELSKLVDELAELTNSKLVTIRIPEKHLKKKEAKTCPIFGTPLNAECKQTGCQFNVGGECRPKREE